MKKKKLNKLRIRADTIKENLQKELFDTDVIIHNVSLPEDKPVVVCLYKLAGEIKLIIAAIKKLGGTHGKIGKTQVDIVYNRKNAIEDYLNATLKPQT